MAMLKERVVCSLEWVAKEEGGEAHCFLNFVLMSPPTICVPCRSIMEPIVLEGESRGILFHFWKPYV